MNRPTYLLSIILVVLGLTLSAYKVQRYGVNIFPKPSADTWRIEARIKVPKSSGSVRVEMATPSSKFGAKVLEERFRSQELPGLILAKENQRKIVWSGRKKKKGSEYLSYTVTMQTGVERGSVSRKILSLKPSTGELVTEVEAKSARNLIRNISRSKLKPLERVQRIIDCVSSGRCGDVPDKFSRLRSSSELKAKSIAALLSDAGFPSIAASGFYADQAQLDAKFSFWIYTKVSGSWEVFPLGALLSLDKLIFWDFLIGDSASPLNLKHSLIPVVESGQGSSDEEANFDSLEWRMLSLESVPVSLQATYQLMLLIPFGALVICFVRTVIGLPTIGTFMPILIALSFRDTGLSWGMLLFLMIVTLGLIVRFSLTYLRLLLVPRLSSVLIIVILLMLVLSRVSFEFGFFQGLTITLFPIVIITMFIERLCLVWEEVGVAQVLTLFGGSMIAATLAYLTMNIPIISYWVFVFPEITLVVLALILLVGRYTGYRFSEIYRFRNISDATDAN